MRKIADRIRWLEENWITKDGHPWRLKGREWVRDEIIRPLHGWQILSGEGDLCAECQPFAGRVVEWSAPLEDVIEGSHHVRHDGACAGLYLRKIQVVVLCVGRRGGKTTNVMACAGELIAHDAWFDAMMFASAGEQTEILFRENLVDPFIRIEADGGDIEDFVVTTKAVRFPEHNSSIHIVDSSRRSVTGRGENLLIIEEARDVDGVLFVKALPSILDRNYLVCANGHRFPFDVEDRERVRKRCPTCTARLQPHYATVVIISSAGILDDSPSLKWFSETVTMLEAEPRPGFYLFRSDDVENPAITRQSRQVLETFELVPSLANLVRAERTNEFTQRGDLFMAEAMYARCYDPQLRHVDGALGRCVLFFDTSLKKDLLSLTILADDDGSAPFWRRGTTAEPLPPWTLVSTPSIYTWEPKDVFRSVDGEAIRHEDVAWDLLSPILPLYPDALDIWVDVRAQPWAHRLVDIAHRSKTPWGRKFRRYQHGGKERDVRRSAFKLFEQRVEGRTLRTFKHQRVSDELAGLIKKIGPDGEWEVVDRSRKLMHADVVSGLAALCERVWLVRVTRASARDVNERLKDSPAARALDKYRLPGRKLTPDSW